MKSVNDHILTQQIKKELEGKMQASAMDINVDVRNGVVQLQGFVDVLAEKQEAERIVRQIPGVKKVENSLTICIEGRVNDRHIEKEIESKLHSHHHPGLVAVNVDVRDGSAVLIGKTDNLALEKQAMQIASTTRGVKNVVSNIRVKDEGLLDDTTIANRVVHALSTTDLSWQDICTDVTNGEVTLSGWVRSREEADLAERVASEVEGVRKIRNRLQTRSRY